MSDLKRDHSSLHTGEPTPTASEIKTMAECVHLGWLRSREEGAQELLKAVFALRAARPPEPSAPQAISGMYISETKPHKVEIFNREPVSDPAPSPTPSVSTEPPMMITPGGDIHEYCPDCRGVCKQVRPAPSVAGTQPPLRHRIADLLKIASSSEGGPSEDAVFDYVKALIGAAKGTPQAQEIADEIVSARYRLPVDASHKEVVAATVKILRLHLSRRTALPEPALPENVRELLERFRELDAVRLSPSAAEQEEMDETLAELLDAAAPAQGTPEPPKVEALAKQIAMECYEHMVLSAAQEISIQNIAAAILRPYFPPASQTPKLKAMTQADQKTYDPIAELEYIAKEIIGEDIALEDLSGRLEFAIQVLKEMKEYVATPASTARTDGAFKEGYKEGLKDAPLYAQAQSAHAAAKMETEEED